MARPLPSLVAAVCVLALSACAATRSSDPFAHVRLDEPFLASAAPRSAPPDAALEELSAARRLQGRGFTAAAVERLRGLIEDHPDYLDGHRLLQDLLLDSTSDWWLRERYAERADARPDEADAWYLRARIEPDWEEQARLFDEALALDPEHAHAWIGRAVAAQRRGDLDDAIAAAQRSARLAPELALPYLFLGHLAAGRGEVDLADRFYAEARERDPEDTRPWLGLARVHLRSGRPSEASRAALEALRLAPADGAVSLFAAEVLDEVGVPEHLEAALQVLDAAATDVGDPGVFHAVRGRLLVAHGDPIEARAALGLAVTAGFAPAEFAVLERRAGLRAALRERGEADTLATSLERLPAEAFADDNLLRPRWERLRSAVSALRVATTQDGAADARVELAEALTAVGWIEEARLVWAAATAARPDDTALRRRAARERGFHAFLTDLRDVGRELAQIRRREVDGPDLDAVLARLREASVRRLGLDVTEGAVVRSYTFLGAFAITTASDGAFAREFGGRGLYLLVGQRSGGPTELVIGRMVLLRRNLTARVLDEDVGFDECWIESAGLPAGLSGLRPGLAGLTLDRFVLLQLDAVLNRPRRLPPDLPFALRPAADAATRRALDTPSRVAARIEWALDAEGRLEAGMIDAVRRHELVHVYDAQRLLPVHGRPLQALGFAVSTGFDARAAERVLEARAAALSIVDCVEPRAALASLLAFLPARDGGSAHPSAYVDVLEHALDIIESDPAAFPSLDRSANLIQQMDRLTDDEIRLLGVRLRDAF